MTVLLAGLLTGGLFASGATPAFARPEHLARTAERGVTTVTARLAPPVVTAGEPAALVAQLSPAQQGRPVTVERYVGGAWAPLLDGTANAAGRAVVPLDTTQPGTQRLRVVAEAWNGGPASAPSRAVTLTVTTPDQCTPRTPLADPDADLAARCLAARLDRWKGAGLMGVGQQLNMSSAAYTAPLAALGSRRVPVVGFDLWELGKTRTYEFPFFDQALADLVAMAQGGAVLTASWHAPNPHTGREYNDRSWHSFGALLDSATPEAQAFWAGYDEQLAVLAALQAEGVAIVFRPFHEVNGDWFWWGRPNAAAFTKVYHQLQERAWAAGVHNVLWGYSFAAANRPGIVAPEKLLPARVDVAGIDSYYPSTGSHRGGQAPSMAGYAAVAKRVPRMAFTEIGPSADKKQSWKPSVITATAKAQPRRPLWALLWVDDASGYKQISSLNGGLSWLDSCPFGFCPVR
ncbi:glycosyl hydrolase [Nocardioides aquiterrae]|uniref:glycosyl hydrolase n=1 Tax=Nocardioides aquiterrae TaxID=203799 RepID=UPI0031CF89EC